MPAKDAFAQPKMASFPAESSEPEARRRAASCYRRPAASTLVRRQPDARLTRTTESVAAYWSTPDLGRTC